MSDGGIASTVTRAGGVRVGKGNGYNYVLAANAYVLINIRMCRTSYFVSV